tara:strand:- start:9840 stop:10928 length:1089 start_codon:yes stop_codon:yes gene_type:complete
MNLNKIKVDVWLLIPILLLSMFGLMVLFSASGGNYSIVKSQFFKIIIGLVSFILISQVKPEKIKTVFSKPFYILTLILLIFVFLFGTKIMGAQRWLNLYVISIQPSELMKLALPMMLGYMIYKNGLPKKNIDIFKYSLIMLMPIFFVLVQPDLGTSILIALSGIYLIFQAGLSWYFITLSSALVFSIFPIFWLLIKDYQKQRILTMFNPELDPLGHGYHTIQSKIAIGNGGFSGKGYFEGTQTQLDFIPEQHTDFIFSALAEEFGTLGYIALILLYSILIGRMIYIILNSESIYEKLVGGSITMIFSSYIFVNIGMVMGILPVVGVPLPFFSYGGTFLITLIFSLGLLSSFSVNKNSKKYYF